MNCLHFGLVRAQQLFFLVGQGCIQKTGPTSFFFFFVHNSFLSVFTLNNLCLNMYYKVFYGMVECTVL